jgi:hypothetical protein
MADDIDISVADTAPELRQGSSGPWVLYLQQLLDSLGYQPGPINSSFGSQTRAAVVRFQTWAQNLPDTGVVDHATWDLLIAKAQDGETVDSAAGWKINQSVADHAKLEPGMQVGHQGWCRVDFQCTVVDHFKRRFPDTQAYVRFEDTQSQERYASDEDGWIKDGVLALNDVWVPRVGVVHLYLHSTQLGEIGWVGQVDGLGNLHTTGANGSVRFHAQQHPGETKTMSYSEAESWAIAHGTTATASISDYIGGSFSGSETVTHSTTYAPGESVSLTFPGSGFELVQES